MDKIITIGIADDHQMYLDSIKSLINSDKKFNVTMVAENGRKLIEKIEKTNEVPSVFLIDINMPFMNGYETIAYLSKNYPHLKCIALSVNNDFVSVFKMIENGAKAYLKKDCRTNQFFETIYQVYSQGTFYNSFVVNSLLDYQHANDEIISLNNPACMMLYNDISKREAEFIVWACSELTYKEIADKMDVSARTVDSFRMSVFNKLNIKSRVGLVLYAVKHNIYLPNNKSKK